MVKPRFPGHVEAPSATRRATDKWAHDTMRPEQLDSGSTHTSQPQEGCALLHPLQGVSLLSTPLQGGILKPPALRVVVDFMAHAPEGTRFIGVELDCLSGRIARALHPGQDIRIENFRDTRLPEHRIDAVIGNVPFADVKLDFQGTRLSLHDFFLAKSLDALKPGGVLAV